MVGILPAAIHSMGIRPTRQQLYEPAGRASTDKIHIQPLPFLAVHAPLTPLIGPKKTLKKHFNNAPISPSSLACDPVLRALLNQR